MQDVMGQSRDIPSLWIIRNRPQFSKVDHSEPSPSFTIGTNTITLLLRQVHIACMHLLQVKK